MTTDLFRSVSDFFNQVEGRFVGYDDTFNVLTSMTTQSNPQQWKGYPPYNIIRDGDNINIEFAVAGFTEKDINVDVQGNTLTIKSVTKNDNSDTNFVFKGIANRSFEKSFQLAKTIVVDDASLKDGILRIFMHDEVPESQKPRQIAINASDKKGGKSQFLRD